MCGIAGSINHQLDISQLTKDLWHRGPDEQATSQRNGLLLHHHRLAIVDIASGKQPMKVNSSLEMTEKEEDAAFTIIFNGEIYNHQELRQKYQLQCKTGSDTETLLHLYAKLGRQMLLELDGMFALAIHDQRKNEVFIARDRAGKKPVYYYFDGKRFLFSSELNALRNQLPLEIAESHIQQFVRMGYFFKANTPYRNVHELPAGSFALVSLHNLELKIERWWNILSYYSNPSSDSFEEALAKTDQILHTAVKRRVESSDLEVGSFLSGGIDSGLVTAIAKTYNNSLKTFTVSFAGEYDEAPLAKLVADRFHTQHHEIKISFTNLQDDIIKILSNYGEPFFDSSAIPSYYVSQAAKQHLTVILNGDGGDEIFGGYRRYVPFALFDFFKSNFITKKLAGLAHGVLPKPNNKKSKYNYLYRLSDLARKDSLDVYLAATVDSFEGYENYLQGRQSLEEVEASFRNINSAHLSGLQKLMCLDFDNILAGDLLVKMDIATMAHSLEGRSPLLAKELLEYIPTLPDSFKIQKGQTKVLLRKLAERYLPAELIHQPKRGFEIPLKKWVDNELKPVIADYILPSNAYCKNYIDPKFLDNVWHRRVNVGDEKRAKMIWTAFTLEVWYKTCFCRS